MKKKENKISTAQSTVKVLTTDNLEELQGQLTVYEKEKNILLQLSSDITKVREKNDLIKVFSSTLKGFFDFTHAVVSLIDQEKNTYYPFLIDTAVLPIRHRDELPTLLKTEYSIHDPFITKSKKSDKPVSFLLDKIIKDPGIPAFLTVNYQCGIKRAMIVPLTSKMETIGYIFIYSEKETEFSAEFKEVLFGIAPHLSNAVSNVIINERIDYNEKVNKILLSLSNDMVMVRDKTNLLHLLKFGLKKIIYFTHNVITLLNESDQTYRAFLVDPDSLTKEFSEYDELIKTNCPFNDGILDIATKSTLPVVFDMSCYDLNQVPLWFKLNYELGAREMIIKALPGEGGPIHTLILFSDRVNNFGNNAIDIIERISSQLSTAISNIAANEEIVNKEKDTSFLLELSQNIASSRTKEELKSSIHKSLKKLDQVQAFFIRTINDDGKTMSPLLYDTDVFFHDSKAFEQLLIEKIPINEGITGRVMMGNVPVSIDMEDEVIENSTDYYVKFWKTLKSKKKDFQKLVGIPLRAGSEKLGILWVITSEINTVILEGIGAQISVAISNINSNEDIISREDEKSILLSITNEIANLRRTDDLLQVVNKQLKTLFKIEDFGFLQINSDDTYSPFMIDMSIKKRIHPDFEKIINSRFSIFDPVFELIMASEGPIILEVDELVLNSDMPAYVRFWKKLGLRQVIAMALRVGGKNIGCAFFHIDSTQAEKIKMNLLKSVCAQISVAISNIRSNEEILNRDQEKSILLSISQEIAALRKAEDLLLVVNKQMKTLFSIEEFGFLEIQEDDTYTPFMFELSEKTLQEAKKIEFSTDRYLISDPVFSRMMNSEEPIIFDVDKLIEKSRIPDYVHFWKKLGYKKVLGTALRVGGKNIGCAFFYIDTVENDKLKISLLKAICNQISVAISNIKSNDEILLREEEKSKLLSLSSEIAALRSRSDLLKVVNSKLKLLLSIEEFGLAKIDEDGSTYSSFVIDVGEDIESDKNYKDVTEAKYDVSDPVFSRIMASEDPILFDVNALARKADVPAYVIFWHKTKVHRVLGMALRVGGENIGCVFLHMAAHETGRFKSNLLKAVCAQLSVAVSNILANERILSYKRMLEVENDHLKEQILTLYNFSDIIGSGLEMQKVFSLMSLVAESNSTVLILGETGTGKELIARAIHNASSRKDKLMVKVNCAALPANLIESELFGHEKGSFTGAIERRIGKFELANNSTLFLDEIGEMPLETQVKLLRVIQERELERVGGNATVKVDVRIIAATNRNLEQEVREGRFRSDLYYRLNVFPISLPPLRERLEDMEDLTEFFLRRFNKNTGKKVTGISQKAMEELKSYLWPGNVRELEHLIERSVLLTQGSMLFEIQLPKKNQGAEQEELNVSSKTLHELERSYIIKILRKCGGKIAGPGGASELLDIPATTLHSKIKKFKISKEEYYA